ncbi:hypothetical protein Xcel_0528 [Xylanimonas cellulosilytica DSM 15894]|uniref:Uncharacterized protein n=1 Tax=Xylanimonas cellulosilytica (strain DSM 15894 / JCM 12276 / CECT 5975 / KCTC 9989 / LMG 20990 / NBRC 107835 / XIL07) TaxID=446471 RepID=D1BW64_XYLCX|nr:hypothetical protein [Xylanimonas cellulosilytica]ACZ29567.1 hypothetical protein Xcel_0528 [Xylanimonas cellulosilytica DSM 15894]
MRSEKSITDDVQPTEQDTTAVSEPALDLDSWISGIAPTERSVPIYGNTQVFGEAEHLKRELATLEAEHAAEFDESIVAGTRVQEILERLAELWEVQQASKTTWYVTALDAQTVKAINKSHPVPDPLPEPEAPSKGAPVSVRGQYETAHAAWERKNPKHEEKRAAALNERNIAHVAAAVVRVEDRHGNVIATGATVAQLKAMEAKPQGPLQVGRLLQATAEAKFGEPVIDAPFSYRTSRGGQG